MKRILMSITLISMSAGIAFAAPVKTVTSALGDVLAAENGMTLYTFKKDEVGKSNCNDACAKNWPPLMATASDKADGSYTIIERKDATKQWAKDGKPLYFWAKDVKLGDTTGNGVKDVWDVARP
ncbi:MAG: COG4315 family predicted lipoprotein [Blastocatellia bacterium]